MTSAGDLYVLFTALLLLIALGAAIPVLKGIVLDGIERQRTGVWRLTPDDTEESPPVDEGTHAICSNCGTRNDDDFVYCHECGTRL